MENLFTLPTEITLGVVTGLIMNSIWYYYWAFYEGNPKSKSKIRGKYAWPRFLQWFEHYHWATILLILGVRLNIFFFLGVSLALFGDEGIGQQHKFSLGSGHEKESFLILALIICMWALIELILKALLPI